MLPIHVATFLVACCIATTVSAPFDDNTVNIPLAGSEDYRLPLTIMPTTYEIKLTPYLRAEDGVKRFTFDGEVTIGIVPRESTKTIVLHSKNLNYTLREYWSEKNTASKLKLDNVDPNPVTDKVTYTLKDDLIANQTYYLHFIYNGTMDDDMLGFYRSSYIDANNETKWIGSTQFQTNRARRAFPSFDEPKFKAQFQVTIVRHKSMRTFSNTRNISSTAVGDNVIDVFAVTPKMSSYILAFIVSDFEERSNNVNFGVIARPEYYNQTKYSFDVGQKLLDELSSYLDINYYKMGVDKMHLAAIPDFSAGAMENWGLLTFRERALLYDEGSTTLNSKQYIAAVVAHEQAHMWFGDLVTCDWWSYTWLNEGFARYFQYFATGKVETNFEMEKQFVVDQIQIVMGMDSTNNTNPMSDINTNTQADLGRMFNSISYNKGATFIRMLKHIIGEQNFQKSLQEYLKKYSNQNTVPQNLFDEWIKYFPEEFKNYANSYFKSYTEQVGYPVVHVTVASNGSSFEVKQKRFLLKENDGSDSLLNYTIPITYTTDKQMDFSNTTPKFFLQSDTQSVHLNAKVNWVIANIQETGYYRVNYDIKNWHGIHHALTAKDWSGIHELNRAQIVDDLLNLARAGLIEYSLALDVLEYLSTEINYLPWTAAFNGYSYLAIRLGADTGEFGNYIKQLTEKAYKELGFEEKTTDSTLAIYNRAKILSWSCKYGNKECIDKSKEYFKKLDSTPVPVNIRSVVYCTAMREGTSDDYEVLLKRFNTTKVATEQTLILSSLGCVKDSKLVEQYFWTIVSDTVRRQDKSSALTSLYSENNENVLPVFKLVTNNDDKLAESLGDYSAVASVISSIAARFTNEEQEKELKSYNEKNKSKFGSAASTLEAAEKAVLENLKWSKERLIHFQAYLKKRSTGGSATRNAFSVLTIILFTFISKFLY